MSFEYANSLLSRIGEDHKRAMREILAFEPSSLTSRALSQEVGLLKENIDVYNSLSMRLDCQSSSYLKSLLTQVNNDRALLMEKILASEEDEQLFENLKNLLYVIRDSQIAMEALHKLIKTTQESHPVDQEIKNIETESHGSHEDESNNPLEELVYIGSNKTIGEEAPVVRNNGECFCFCGGIRMKVDPHWVTTKSKYETIKNTHEFNKYVGTLPKEILFSPPVPPEPKVVPPIDLKPLKESPLNMPL